MVENYNILGVSDDVILTHGELDWAATSAAANAHYEATGQWGQLEDFYVYRDAAAPQAPTVLAPAEPATTPAPVQVGDGDVNILLRGQSNALLFADQGGVYALEQKLQAALGVTVHILAEYGTDTSTIHAGTAFLDWDTDGEQASLLQYLNNQPADIRDNPTVTVWMHNEYEQQGGGTEAQWLDEVLADAVLVREALGQDASTTPYVFTPVPYNYGSNWSWLEGMKELVQNPAFNASMSNAFTGAIMDGDGYAHSSHMGGSDQALVASALARDLAPIVAQLSGHAEAFILDGVDHLAASDFIFT
jgi:hypothetical protein